MKIAVLGTGVVGQTLAEKLAELNNDVMMGSRNIADLLSKSKPDNFGRPPFKEWIKQHQKIKFATFSEAAAFGEFIINATNGMGSLEALKLAGEKNLNSKVLLDVSNPLDFSKGFPPTLFVCNTDSLAEQIQRTFPNAKVVKSLNTMNAYIMTNPSLVPGDHNVFVNGNDAGAKTEVKKLLNSFGWKNENILDVGDIKLARGTEMYVFFWAQLFGAFQTGTFNIHIAK
jgi:predicted dinucleotide-binding enzyme